MRGASAAIAAAALLALPACLAVPLPESGHMYGRAALAQADLSFLKEGETTREQVLLRLGAPDLALRSGDVLAYAWGGSGGFWIVAAGLSGTGGSIPVHHLLVLEFAADGRLRHARSSAGRGLWHADAPVVSAEGARPQAPTLIVDPLADIWTRFDPTERGAPRARVRLGDFRDEREAPFAGTLVAQVPLRRIPGAEVHLRRSASETIRAAVEQALRNAGFVPVERGEDWTVSGVIRHFEFQSGLRLWPVQLDVTVEAHGGPGTVEVTHRYACTLANDLPPNPVFGKLADALAELQLRIAADAELLGLLGTRGPERGAAER